MPESEQQDRTLSELVVKEAVGKGLDSSMRESILEAVEEADGSHEQRSLGLAAGAFGLGAALGFLAGRESPTLEETPLSDVDEPDVIEDVMGSDTETETESAVEETTEAVEEVTGDEAAATDEGGSGFMRLVLLVGAIVGIAYLRRRFSGEEEEWEPIEEFEPASDLAEKAEEGLEDVAESEMGIEDEGGDEGADEDTASDSDGVGDDGDEEADAEDEGEDEDEDDE
ncbi:hypothetical protein C483_00590 [Natrialba hulunbeirensis JCM 10989]|uniref:Uncharacterized protein n=1 Tax=Natrialba hulunbeirensis JCM 10989 TaxID=1227493 RepID=M0ABF6_9EURY|nr:hypothetical protein [Natrialba hulunbeirensis]ELY95731.1 hypothetical protein C483_00590 [Natrialba hulunbeirensis JCM 10989]